MEQRKRGEERDEHRGKRVEHREDREKIKKVKGTRWTMTKHGLRCVSPSRPNNNII